jgi:hypothetical protein
MNDQRLGTRQGRGTCSREVIPPALAASCPLREDNAFAFLGVPFPITTDEIREDLGGQRTLRERCHGIRSEKRLPAFRIRTGLELNNPLGVTPAGFFIAADDATNAYACPSFYGKPVLGTTAACRDSGTWVPARSRRS